MIKCVQSFVIRNLMLQVKQNKLKSQKDKLKLQKRISRKPKRRLKKCWIRSIKKKSTDREEQNKQQLQKKLTTSTNLSLNLRQILTLQRSNLKTQKVQRNGSSQLLITQMDPGYQKISSWPKKILYMLRRTSWNSNPRLMTLQVHTQSKRMSRKLRQLLRRMLTQFRHRLI